MPAKHIINISTFETLRREGGRAGIELAINFTAGGYFFHLHTCTGRKKVFRYHQHIGLDSSKVIDPQIWNEFFEMNEST